MNSPLTPLTLDYSGPTQSVAVYAEGQLVIHTGAAPHDAEKPLLFSLQGGPHALNTLHPLVVTLIHGKASLGLGARKPKPLRLGKSVTIPAGSAFTLIARDFVQIIGKPTPGPGYGSTWKPPGIIR